MKIEFENGSSFEVINSCNNVRSKRGEEQIEQIRNGIEAFDADFNLIKTEFPDLKDGHIGCYLCNFEDEYICKEYNGGCKSITVCQEIQKAMNE